MAIDPDDIRTDVRDHFGRPTLGDMDSFSEFATKLDVEIMQRDLAREYGEDEDWVEFGDDQVTDSINEILDHLDLVDVTAHALRAPRSSNEAKDTEGRLFSYLRKHGLDELFSDYEDSEQDGFLQLAILPDGETVSVKWRSSRGDVFGKLHCEEQIHDPVKPKKPRNTISRQIATGHFTIETDKDPKYRLFAEFTYGRGKKPLSCGIRICLDEKQDCFTHTRALVDDQGACIVIWSPSKDERQIWP